MTPLEGQPVHAREATINKQSRIQTNRDICGEGAALPPPVAAAVVAAAHLLLHLWQQCPHWDEALPEDVKDRADGASLPSSSSQY